MQENGLGRFFLSLLVVLGVNFAVSYLCSILGIFGIPAIVIYSLVIAFLFTCMNVRKGYLKLALKSPLFYRNMCITFIIIFGIEMLFLFI